MAPGGAVGLGCKSPIVHPRRFHHTHGRYPGAGHPFRGAGGSRGFRDSLQFDGIATRVARGRLDAPLMTLLGLSHSYSRRLPALG